MRRICVFCGSSSGAWPECLDAAAQLGHALARNTIAVNSRHKRALCCRGAGIILDHERAHAV